MGYRSDVVIGMTVTVYTQHLLLFNDLPKLLRDTLPFKSGEKVYWEINGIKWSNTWPEVQELAQFFIQLDEEFNAMNLSVKGNRAYIQEDLYGAIRLGEDDQDVESWGSPHDFDIFVCRSIERPCPD